MNDITKSVLEYLGTFMFFGSIIAGFIGIVIAIGSLFGLNNDLANGLITVGVSVVIFILSVIVLNITADYDYEKSKMPQTRTVEKSKKLPIPLVKRKNIKCASCGAPIHSENGDLCPYCGSRVR